MDSQPTLIDYIQASMRKNWNALALTNYEGDSYQYRDVARKIAKLHLMFESAGVAQGDRIAICGRNSAHWAVASLAAITYGAVAVPILHEFKPDTIHHLVTHSEARLLFTDPAIWNQLAGDEMPQLEGVVQIVDYSLLLSRSGRLTEARARLNEMFGHKYPERFTPDDVIYPKGDLDRLVLINYTSGSTGFSKGVMLTDRALWSNLQFGMDRIPWLKAGDQLVSMLPLAHMYGLTVEMLLPFIKGCHVNFLTRQPSPGVIMAAFAALKPKLIVAVPLIIEKIIRNKVFPLLSKPLMRVLLHVPFVDDQLLGKIKAKLEETFGGNLKELVIGGAPVSKEVETFLRRIKFPYTVGYGMTECAPLITYSDWDQQRPGSCGQLVDRMEAQVDSSDPANIPGELRVRGDNVMTGYYKNPEETARAIDPDGWLRTGDMVTIDPEGYVYIRGRNKTMILGPSGQNIYPEEIELRLNTLPYVDESLVIDDGDGKLAALVLPDYETASTQGITPERLGQIMEENVKALNADLPAYSRISRTEVRHEPFEKTPKRSIKRYLYQKQ